MLISTANPLWDPVLKIAEKLGQKMPEGEHNFVPNCDLINFLRLRGFRLINSGTAMLLPKRIPAVSGWINRLAPRLPVLKRFCVIQTIVAEKVTDYSDRFHTDMTCSVIIPWRDETVDLFPFSRVPDMGKRTEVIIVADSASPGIAGKVDGLTEKDPRVRLVSYSPEYGEACAIRQGFHQSTGDVLMILDPNPKAP